MLTELSLFSGYGGFSLGLRLAGLDVKTVGYVEIEPYCQKILQARIRDGFCNWAPIIKDITCTNFRPMAGLVDIITGGFPCQPHSNAGKRLGKEDPRNLWPDTLRCIREVGPSYVLLENVRGLVDGANPYAAEIIGQLSEIGYDARWGIVSAKSIGANHKRERWFCLAYSNNIKYNQSNSKNRPANIRSTSWGKELWFARCSEDVANTAGSRWATWPSKRKSRGESKRFELEKGWWAIEPNVGRVADGVTFRVDRLKAIGNGIVPAVVAEFLRIIEDESNT